MNAANYYILDRTHGARTDKRSYENPSVPLSKIDDDDPMWDVLTGGSRSYSGVRVNSKMALKFSPFWRGVNLLSKDVGKLPLFVHKREGEGKTRAKEHPSYARLRHKPNAEMTAFHFKSTLTAHAVSRGNGYAYIERRGDGSVDEIIPLMPDRTYPVRENGRLWYVTSIGGPLDDTQSELRKLAPENVLHIKGLGFDGLVGYDVISAARDTLGLGIGSHRFSSVYFKNAAHPNVVLEHPGRIGDKAFQRITSSWKTMRSGLENAHKTAILEEGMKANAFEVDARKAQMIEALKFSIVEVSNILGVPVHKLGGEGRTSFASLEQENQSYLDCGLDPWLIAWEEECWDKLLTEEEKRQDTHLVEFERKALIRADLTRRGAFYRQATGGHPFMSVNEVRALENLNPIDGFDDIPKPLNMQTGPASEDPPEDKDETEDDSEQQQEEKQRPFRRLLADAVSRVAKRLQTQFARAAKREGLDEWRQTFAAEHRDVCLEMLTPSTDVARMVTGNPQDAHRTAEAVFSAITREIGQAETFPIDLTERITTLFFEDLEPCS